MTRLPAVLFLAVLATGQQLPNPQLTPGSVRTTDKNVICSTRTGTVRKVRAGDRRQAFTNYGIDCAKVKCGQRFEVDHLVSLEIGGGNELANLWPQAYARIGAHAKDLLENKLHKMICDGRISPQQAQKEIAKDWYKSYRKYVRKSDAALPR